MCVCVCVCVCVFVSVCGQGGRGEGEGRGGESTIVQIIRIWKWKHNVMLEFTYLKNKKWWKQAVKSARIKKNYIIY